MNSPTSPLIEDLPGDRDSHPSTSSSYRNPIEAYLAGTLNEPDYIRLLRLKEEGWKNEELESHYEKKRRELPHYERQPCFDPKLNVFFPKGIEVMKELDRVHKVIPKSEALTFLDICCCPGGFSQYILQVNHLANGNGLSLSPPAGYQLSIKEHEFDRFQVAYQDITRYDFYTDYMSLSDHELATLPTPLNTLDLCPLPAVALQDFIIADGQVLRDYNVRGAESFPSHPAGFGPYSALLYAQLVIGLIFLRPGGTFVFRTTHCDRYHTMNLIQKMQAISSVKCFKPTKCWSDRSSFYVIAKRVRTNSPECAELVRTWVQYIYYTTTRNEIPKELSEEYGSEREQEAIRRGEISQLVPILKKIWKVQADGMEWKLQKRSGWRRGKAFKA